MTTKNDNDRYGYLIVAYLIFVVILCAVYLFLFSICKKAYAKSVTDEAAEVESEVETEEAEKKQIIKGVRVVERETEIIFQKVVEEPKEEQEEESQEFVWDGPKLNSYLGVVQGPSGKETYYNLPMDGVISIMRNAGFSETEYPYWVRDDGCKMLGDYIMVAADLSIRPRGSLVECSLGHAIVCDTGEFIYSNPYQLDIAVTW